MPPSLSALVGMILGDYTTRSNSDNVISTAVSSITQLFVFNSVKKRTDSTSVRHNLSREPAFPLYIGLLIHNKTRKRGLIDNLFENGLSVSYDRVLQLSTNEANKCIDRYEQERVVCPTALKNNLFTTGNLDNIDHNPTATSSYDSFHGTGISITQHLANDNSGSELVFQDIPENSTNMALTTIKSLPQAYTDVPLVSFLGNVVPPNTYWQVIPSQFSTEHDDEKMLFKV